MFDTVLKDDMIAVLQRCCLCSDPCTYLGEGTSYSLGEPCYEYYVCVNWVSQRRKCVSGKSYNFIAQQCVEDHKCMQTSKYDL